MSSGQSFLTDTETICATINPGTKNDAASIHETHTIDITSIEHLSIDKSHDHTLSNLMNHSVKNSSREPQMESIEDKMSKELKRRKDLLYEDKIPKQSRRKQNSCIESSTVFKRLHNHALK